MQGQNSSILSQLSADRHQYYYLNFSWPTLTYTKWGSSSTDGKIAASFSYCIVNVASDHCQQVHFSTTTGLPVARAAHSLPSPLQRQFRFTFSPLYWQTKPAVLLSEKLQPKLNSHTKSLILYCEKAKNSIYAESNFQIYGAFCFIIYRSDNLEAQTTLILAALVNHAEIVSTCYLCQAGNSNKEYSPQLQTRGMLDVWLWALPKPTPPFSLEASQILSTLTSVKIWLTPLWLPNFFITWRVLLTHQFNFTSRS